MAGTWFPSNVPASACDWSATAPSRPPSDSRKAAIASTHARILADEVIEALLERLRGPVRYRRPPHQIAQAVAGRRAGFEHRAERRTRRFSAVPEVEEQGDAACQAIVRLLGGAGLFGPDAARREHEAPAGGHADRAEAAHGHERKRGQVRRTSGHDRRMIFAPAVRADTRHPLRGSRTSGRSRGTRSSRRHRAGRGCSSATRGGRRSLRRARALLPARPRARSSCSCRPPAAGRSQRPSRRANGAPGKFRASRRTTTST